jgi:hypothetical protein
MAIEYRMSLSVNPGGLCRALERHPLLLKFFGIFSLNVPAHRKFELTSENSKCRFKLICSANAFTVRGVRPGDTSANTAHCRLVGLCG